MTRSDLQEQRQCLYLMLGPNKWDSLVVSREKGIPAPTLRKWRLHFEKYGESPAETRKRLKGRQHMHCRGFTDVARVILRQIVRAEPWLYLDELQRKLKQQSGIKVHCSTIYRALVADGWTLKKAVNSACRRDEVLRAEHRTKMWSVTDDPSQFLFVDETAKDRLASRRGRAWQPRGSSTDIARAFGAHSDFRYTMLGAADLNGFITEACEMVRRKSGADDADPAAGTIDGERFVEWVEHRLVPVLGNYARGEPRSIVIMDNATTHNSPRINELITAVGAILIYQSPYSPDLNPIERCFHQYKAFLKRHSGLLGTPETAHNRALLIVSRKNMCNYYASMECIRNVPDVDEHVNIARIRKAVVDAVVNNNSLVMRNLTDL
jgi:transposase